MSANISRREAITYAAAAAGAAALGMTAPAPRANAAPGLRLIDFATRQVAPDRIKAAGYDGALVYVSELRPGATFDFKPVTREFTDGLRANGLHVVSIYQYGKPGWVNSPSDFTRGFDGGVADAQTALRIHGAAGGPATAPIYFSVDEPLDYTTWKNVALQWFRGLNSVLGVERTGIYGGVNELGWAIGDGVVGHSTTPGYRWAWQTKAWSGGKLHPAAPLYQMEVVTASDPGALIDGISVDVDQVFAADFGQWDLPR